MGLFDMFGVGGGKVAIQPQSPHVSAGGGLAGVVAFQGGSRPQQITNVTLKLVLDQQVQEMGPQGPRQTTRSQDVVPAHPIVGAFQSTANQVQQFQFNLQLPAGLPNSTPGQVKYRLVASADIDGEVDPGANCEIQVVGGVQPQGMMQGGMQPQGMMQPGMMQGGMMQPGMMQGGMQPGMMQPGMPMQPGMMQPGMPMQPPQQMGPPQIGQDVMAQYQDGSMRPARVVAMQNGMLGVDWHDPALGASSWIYPQQVQPMQMMQPGMMQPGMPMQGQMHDASAMKAKANAQHAQAQKGYDPKQQGYDAKQGQGQPQKGFDPKQQGYDAKQGQGQQHHQNQPQHHQNQGHQQHVKGNAPQQGNPKKGNH